MTATTCTDCGADLHKAAEIAAGICVRCYDDDGFEAEMEELDDEPEYRTCHRCGSGPRMMRGVLCDFCKRALLRGTFEAERAIYADATVAIEDEIDERDDAANERAEREEERERDEAEWAAEQGEEIIVEACDAR